MVASTINGCNGRINHQPSTIEHQQHDKMVASTTNRMVASTINHQPLNINSMTKWLHQPPTEWLHRPSTGWWQMVADGCINHQPSMVAMVAMVASTINHRPLNIDSMTKNSCINHQQNGCIDHQQNGCKWLRMVASTINHQWLPCSCSTNKWKQRYNPLTFEKIVEEGPVGVALSSKRFFGLVGKTLKGCG